MVRYFMLRTSLRVGGQVEFRWEGGGDSPSLLLSALVRVALPLARLGVAFVALETVKVEASLLVEGGVADLLWWLMCILSVVILSCSLQGC